MSSAMNSFRPLQVSAARGVAGDKQCGGDIVLLKFFFQFSELHNRDADDFQNLMIQRHISAVL